MPPANKEYFTHLSGCLERKAERWVALVAANRVAAESNMRIQWTVEASGCGAVAFELLDRQRLEIFVAIFCYGRIREQRSRTQYVRVDNVHTYTFDLLSWILGDGHRTINCLVCIDCAFML